MGFDHFASLSVCEGFRQGHYTLLMESLAVLRKKNKTFGGDGDASEKRWKFVGKEKTDEDKGLKRMEGTSVE
ncbi:hypothetical protein MRB53_029140 [Persea americana]|uniref:Uncharacterized protein n=1 Tax=Persea americana TaxID=3435 RepID=A0ACC2KHQ4_PERAE|nr:hypothetical protein MRB53_029140 [Persea americana]